MFYLLTDVLIDVLIGCADTWHCQAGKTQFADEDQKRLYSRYRWSITSKPPNVDDCKEAMSIWLTPAWCTSDISPLNETLIMRSVDEHGLACPSHCVNLLR